MGHEVNKIGFDYLEYLVPCYYIDDSEASSNLSRYDGIRYGYRSPKDKTLRMLYTMPRSRRLRKGGEKKGLCWALFPSEA
ncbi:MAG: hypothetical protein IPL08_19840 [Saprospiraceae bacterium]|nr:hypothetical protein [Saprospiraceae bacterium]